MNYIRNELEEKGYIILPEILTPTEIKEAKNQFYSWKNKVPYHDTFHDYFEGNGIYKYHEVGHQRFAWLIRTNPRVQNIFKYLWKCQDLIVSFDGACYMDANTSREDKHWTHTDQAPNKRGLYCYQGLVSLTDNKERTLVVYEGSHKLHQKYFEVNDITSSSDWYVFQEDYIKSLKDRKRILSIPAGALVIWDSRTYHQNQFGKPYSEERLVQYVCYFPKDHPDNTEEMSKLRKAFFRQKRTTTHWPTPITKVPLQPFLADFSSVIDYNQLELPNLEDLYEKIKELL